MWNSSKFRFISFQLCIHTSRSGGTFNLHPRILLKTTLDRSFWTFINSWNSIGKLNNTTSNDIPSVLGFFFNFFRNMCLFNWNLWCDTRLLRLRIRKIRFIFKSEVAGNFFNYLNKKFNVEATFYTHFSLKSAVNTVSELTNTFGVVGAESKRKWCRIVQNQSLAQNAYLENFLKRRRSCVANAICINSAAFRDLLNFLFRYHLLYRDHIILAAT